MLSKLSESQFHEYYQFVMKSNSPSRSLYTLVREGKINHSVFDRFINEMFLQKHQEAAKPVRVGDPDQFI